MLNKNKFILSSVTFRVTKSQRSACTVQRMEDIRNPFKIIFEKH